MPCVTSYVCASSQPYLIYSVLGQNVPRICTIRKNCVYPTKNVVFFVTPPGFLHGFAYRDPIFYIILHTELEFLHDFAYRALFFYIFLHRPPCFFARFCIPLGFSEKIALTWCRNLPIFAQKFPKFNAKTAHRNNSINNNINNSINDSSAHTREAAAQPRKQKKIF